MVKLRNIKKNNGIISASYEPENSGQVGYIEIDESGEVIKEELSEYDKDLPTHFQHAVKALKEFMKKDDIPKEYTLTWY